MECSICTEAVEGAEGNHAAAALRCGHVFGKHCIERWLLQQNTCPACKKRSSPGSSIVLRLSEDSSLSAAPVAASEASQRELQRQRVRAATAEREVKRLSRLLKKARTQIQHLHSANTPARTNQQKQDHAQILLSEGCLDGKENAIQADSSSAPCGNLSASHSGKLHAGRNTRSDDSVVFSLCCDMPLDGIVAASFTARSGGLIIGATKTAVHAAPIAKPKAVSKRACVPFGCRIVDVHATACGFVALACCGPSSVRVIALESGTSVFNASLPCAPTCVCWDADVKVYVGLSDSRIAVIDSRDPSQPKHLFHVSAVPITLNLVQDAVEVTSAGTNGAEVVQMYKYGDLSHSTAPVSAGTACATSLCSNSLLVSLDRNKHTLQLWYSAELAAEASEGLGLEDALHVSFDNSKQVIVKCGARGASLIDLLLKQQQLQRAAQR